MSQFDNFIVPTDNAADRREFPRLGIQVRVSILGVDAKTTLYNETTETLDISTKGVRLILSVPVQIGGHISISANHPNLQARLAVFLIRWVQPYEGQFMIGAELESGSDKWNVADE